MYLMKKNNLTALILAISLGIFGCSTTMPIKSDFQRSPALRPFYDTYWVLLEDLHFKMLREEDHEQFDIIIPAGFVTDLASIPSILTPIYNKYSRYASPGIVHDFLYWTHACNDRNVSDRILKEALKGLGSGYSARNTIKKGVQWFGGTSWEKNQKEREQGFTRYIPDGMRGIKPSDRWKVRRKEFKNIPTPWDHLYSKEPNICKVFDIKVAVNIN